MPEDCIFCKIVKGEIPTEFLYQGEEAVAFRDINPAAPVHLLVVSRKHIPSLKDLTGEDLSLIGHMTGIANRLAEEQGITGSGYRVVINCGAGAGQTVPHLHMHLLGGRELTWSH